MGEQGSLFDTDFANRLRARVLARREDPATSKQAARRKARRLTQGQEEAMATLIAYGPGTTHQLAWAAMVHDFSGRPDRATAIHHELARRLPELARKGKARVQRDTDGTERTFNGSRIWERVP